MQVTQVVAGPSAGRAGETGSTLPRPARHDPGWALFGAFALRDPALALSSARASEIAVRLARRTALWIGHDTFMGMLLRDIGTLDTPGCLLAKPGPLDDRERSVVAEHSLRSALLLRDIPGCSDGATVALHHHERWDGAGHPLGLSGRAIPAAARLVAVSDVFTALTEPRPFRDQLDAQDAAMVVVAEAGSKLDPDLAIVFADLVRTLPDELKRRRLAPDWLTFRAQRARELSRGQLEALFASALGLAADDAAGRFGRSAGTQRNWQSSLRRTLCCPARQALPRFLTGVGRSLVGELDLQQP